MGRGRHQVGGTRPERGQADARLARQPPIRGRHEAGGLLMTGEHEPDARMAQRLQQVEVFFTGNAEQVLDLLGLQRLHEQV